MKFLTTITAVILFAAIGRATAGQGTEAQAPVAPRISVNVLIGKCGLWRYGTP